MSVEISLPKDERGSPLPRLATVPSHATVSKAPASLLAIAQLMLASVQLVENTILVSLDAGVFRYAEARMAVVFVWSLTVAWMLTIALLLYGIMSNRCAFILPHICFSALLLLVKAAVLAVLVVSASFALSIIVCALTVVVLALSLRAESRCYAQMRAVDVAARKLSVIVLPRRHHNYRHSASRLSNDKPNAC